MSAENVIDGFIGEFRKLKDKQLITDDWVNHYTYCSRGQFHSMILGALAKVGSMLGYIVNIERKWELLKGYEKGKKKQWAIKPDLSYLDENGNPVLFIDFNTMDMLFSIKEKLDMTKYYWCHAKDKITATEYILFQTLPKIPIYRIKGMPKGIRDPTDQYLGNYDISNWDKNKSLWEIFHSEITLNRIRELIANSKSTVLFVSHEPRDIQPI